MASMPATISAVSLWPVFEYHLRDSLGVRFAERPAPLRRSADPKMIMRCSTDGASPAASSDNIRRTTEAFSCGSTGRRSTSWPAPTSTRAADPRRQGPSRRGNGTSRRVSRRRACDDLALLTMAAYRTALDAAVGLRSRSCATIGFKAQLAIAPAGAGKTIALHALTLAWTQDGGQVLGLAPLGCRGRCSWRAHRHSR